MSLQSCGFPSTVKTPSVVSAEVPDVSGELDTQWKGRAWRTVSRVAVEGRGQLETALRGIILVHRSPSFKMPGAGGN